MTTLMEPPVEQDAPQAEERVAEISRTSLLPIPPLRIIQDSGIHAEVCEITPDIARALLTHRRFQRPAAQATVNRYARDMTHGDWKLTGQPIILSGANGWEVKDGHLYLRDDQGSYDEIETEDAQQRLLAVAQSDVTIQALVVWGIDPMVRSVLDTGKGRTLSDYLNYAHSLGIDGSLVNASTLATVTKRYSQIEQAWRGDKPVAPTTSEALDWIERNIEVVASVNLAESQRENLPALAKPDVLALVGFHLRQVFGEDAEREFVTKFATLAGLPEGHSCIVARRVLDGMTAKKDTRGTWRDHFRIVLNAAALSMADVFPVRDAQVRQKPKGKAIPAPLVAEAHLGAVE